MEFHKVALIYPEMTQDEFESLKANIEMNGQKQPIWTYENQIIDGRNRYKACTELGIEPQYCEWDGKGSLTQFVISMNSSRRHLTPAQKAAISVELQKLLAEEAKVRQGMRTDLSNNPESFPESFGEAREQAGKIVGVNGHYVSDAKSISEKAPDVFNLIKKGNLTIPVAKKLVNLTTSDERTEIIRDLENGKLSTKEISKRLKKDRTLNENVVDDSSHIEKWHPFKGESEANTWARETFQKNDNFRKFCRLIIDQIEKSQLQQNVEVVEVHGE